MSTEGDVQNFIQRLDDLLLRYSDLINMNYDRECLRSMKFQEMKYKEKISVLETKLKLTKLKLKLETDLRKKSEEEHEKIMETFQSKSYNKAKRLDTLSSSNSTSNDNFVTALNSLVYAENDLNESNLLPSIFRKHRANTSTSYRDEIDSKMNFSRLTKLSSRNSHRFTTKIKSPDISYPGFEKLKEKYPNEFDNSPELSPIRNIKLKSDLKHSEYRKPPLNNGPEKSVRNLLEDIQVTPTKNSSYSYFSPRKERSPFHRESPCLNIMLDHCHLHESSNNERSISRLAPLIPPMIPMTIIHCIDEIEKRGLNEIGLYRMAGNEEDIMNLHEKFENFEMNIDLSDINIHSIAAFLKSFLCNFPLILKPFHDAFAQIIIENVKDDLYYAISDLPQANRDTLAYLIIHLRRVSFSASCKMSASRLSAVFGPILFGMPVCDKENQLSEISVRVMEEFLKLPSSYWNSFIVDPTSSETPTKLRNSPTTERIVHKKASKYFSTNVPKKKFFK